MIERCESHQKEVICIVNDPISNSVLKCQVCLTEQNICSSKLVTLKALKDTSQPIPWPSLEFYHYEKQLNGLDQLGTDKINKLQEFLQLYSKRSRDVNVDTTEYYLFLKNIMDELKRSRQWFDDLGIKSHINDILFSQNLTTSEKNLSLQKVLNEDKGMHLQEVSKKKQRNMEIHKILSINFLDSMNKRQQLFQERVEMIKIFMSFKEGKSQVPLVRNQQDIGQTIQKPEMQGHQLQQLNKPIQTQPQRKESSPQVSQQQPCRFCNLFHPLPQSLQQLPKVAQKPLDSKLA